jgi:hypothetical protein
MRRTNFTHTSHLQWLLLPLAMFFFVSQASAQTMTCNNLVQVSVDPTPNGSCLIELTEDMILEGTYPAGDYLLQVMHNINVLYSGINTVTFSGAPHLGQTLTVKVTRVATGNSCTGSIKVEDKAAPIVLCQNVTIPCTSDYNNVPFPDADDNCDLFPNVELTDVFVFDPNVCPDGIAQVNRIFIATDASGNQSATCVQTITIVRTQPGEIDFPNDIEWECNQYDSYPGITNATALHPTVAALGTPCGGQINATGISAGNVLSNTGSGIVVGIDGQYCNYAVTFSDQTLSTCGNTFKIVRTWTVLDWCASNIVTANNCQEDNIQIIKVVDKTGPTVVRAPFTVSANIPGQHPQPCRSQGYLPPATVTDNCNSFTIRIFTPIGEANYVNGQNGTQGGFIPAPGLGIGTHTILYQAEDVCNNITELFVTIEVVDNITPTAICLEFTDVNLSSDGFAIVPASVFNNGSFDNCCLDKFEVRRMNGDCNGNFDNFGPTVTFCCSDVGTTVVVVFRVYDCNGNFNDGMVNAQINDKLPPILLNCPQNVTITCDNYLQNLAPSLALGDNSVLNQFGTASYYDNCQVTVNSNVTVNINTCAEGTITRVWTAQDGSGNNGQTCSQTIIVNHVNFWEVQFPADITAQCVNGTLPSFGEPTVFFDECELIGISFENQVFTVVPDACYKIVRTWTAINWCVYNPAGNNTIPDPLVGLRRYRSGSDGFVQYQQVIKVVDNDAPNFTVPTIDGCIVSSGCTKTVNLPYPVIDDQCSLNFTVGITGAFGTFNNISAAGVNIPNVGPGTYNITYSVTDNCGNTRFQAVTVVVEDCKKPTPYCVNGLIIEIMQTGMIDVWAADFDAGSFDNCGPVKLSFSPNVNDIDRIYDCGDLGQNTIQLWVTDNAGNQDFCHTFVIVQDNMGVCGGNPIISGGITNELNSPVQGVNVELSGNGNISQVSDASGNYSFTVVQGGDYTITPSLNTNAVNGVTTLDLVAISKHILQIQPLNSPYKIIAADANRSNTVTTADMVAIRRVILHIDTEFPNNTSWRFVPKSHVFVNPANPFQGGFPEVLNYNNIVSNQAFADFFAIKVGDVNNSASTNADGDDTQNRTFGTLVLNAQDRVVAAGEEFMVEFTAADFRVEGYQFTLNFDASALQLVDIVEGVAGNENFGLTMLNEGVITTSWNGQANNNEVLFALVFKATKGAQLSNLVYLNSRYTSAEAYNLNGDLLNVQLAFNGVTVEGGFELYQNVPNPFQAETQIGFNLPEAGTATLTVVDVSGKVLKLVRGEFAKGYNQVTLNANELPASGVLYYTLESASNTATKMMVIVR